VDRLRRRPDLARYGAALACASCAILARLVLVPSIGGRLPYFLVYPAVMISARFWGVGPATFVLLLSAAGTELITGDRDPLRLLLLLCVGSFSIWIISALRKAWARAEQNAQIAEERLLQLREETAHRAREERVSAQLRAVVESSGDAIISTGLDGVVQSWNQGAEQVFGYSADEAAGRHISFLVPANRSQEQSEILERIRQGGLTRHFETVCLRKDGKEIHVSLTISPVLEANQVTGASHIARDITERKQFEAHLLQSQKLESLGVMAGGLAHDFNNLLTGIMGNASLAVQELTPSDPAQMRLSEILHASEKAAILVRQMLAYAGKGRFVIEPLNLSTQVAEIVPLVRSAFSRLVELDLKLDPELPMVEADRAQIQQLLINLVVNAAEAVGNRPGGVTVKTYSQNTDSGQTVVLEVKDTGSGMSPETQARIFDPFFTTKFTGRGLGLSAALGIIRTHRGTISVESAPGKGSTFTVVLPAVTSASTATDAPPPRASTGGHVLVVDDEEIVREMARATLERCGYTIEVACDGKAAVAEFASRPTDFDAVLLDLGMPVMNGEEALERIREIRPDVPVLLSSGYTETEATRRFQDRGLAGFLQKPYTASALADKVGYAVSLNVKPAAVAVTEEHLSAVQKTIDASSSPRSG